MRGRGDGSRDARGRRRTESGARSALAHVSGGAAAASPRRRDAFSSPSSRLVPRAPASGGTFSVAPTAARTRRVADERAPSPAGAGEDPRRSARAGATMVIVRAERRARGGLCAALADVRGPRAESREPGRERKSCRPAVREASRSGPPRAGPNRFAGAASNGKKKESGVFKPSTEGSRPKNHNLPCCQVSAPRTTPLRSATRFFPTQLPFESVRHRETIDARRRRARATLPSALRGVTSRAGGDRR